MMMMNNQSSIKLSKAMITRNFLFNNNRTFSNDRNKRYISSSSSSSSSDSKTIISNPPRSEKNLKDERKTLNFKIYEDREIGRRNLSSGGGSSSNSKVDDGDDIVRAIGYYENGDPDKVLRFLKYRLPLEKRVLGKDQLKLKFKLSPINPADINTIQGKYPWKPTKKELKIMNSKKNEDNDDDEIERSKESVFIAGNEGLAEVLEVGDGIDKDRFKVGDWVVMGKPQLGTWQSHINLSVDEVIKLPRSKNLTEIQASTISVNISTAYRLIKDYFPFKNPSNHKSSDVEQPWIIQNGANSNVGQYVLQLCKAWNIGCIGLIRDRPNVNDLKDHLRSLGAKDRTKILTYEEMMMMMIGKRDSKEIEKNSSSDLKKLEIVLGLNCVSGNEETLGLMKVLKAGSKLITYGGMSMKPMTIPTSLILFKDLKLEGFMLTNWIMNKGLDERKIMFEELVKLIDDRKISLDQNDFERSSFEVIDLSSKINENNENENENENEEEEEVIEKIVKEKVEESRIGKTGKKYLLKFS